MCLCAFDLYSYILLIHWIWFLLECAIHVSMCSISWSFLLGWCAFGLYSYIFSRIYFETSVASVCLPTLGLNFQALFSNRGPLAYIHILCFPIWFWTSFVLVCQIQYIGALYCFGVPSAYILTIVFYNCHQEVFEQWLLKIIHILVCWISWSFPSRRCAFGLYS